MKLPGFQNHLKIKELQASQTSKHLLSAYYLKKKDRMIIYFYFQSLTNCKVNRSCLNLCIFAYLQYKIIW